MTKAIPELELLAPRDPNIEANTDEWPELTLTNAYVYLPDEPTELVSLLEAATGHPLTVVGQLEALEDEDEQLYVNGPPQGKVQPTVILDNVRMYSYGQFTDGTIAIWAAGKAGWYTIKPAKKYQSIHDKMCEAVNVLYFIVDAYREVRKVGRGKKAEVLPDYTTQELFQKYAEEQLDEDDLKKGEEAVYQHKEFIISSMMAGKEGLAWKKYPLYRTIFKKFPDIVSQLKKRQQAPPTKGKGSSEELNTNSQYTRKVSVDTLSATSTLKRKRGKPARGGAVEVISLDDTSDTSCDVTGLEHQENLLGSVKELQLPKAKSGAGPRRARIPSAPATKPVATPAKDEDSDAELRARNQKNKSSLRPRASKASKSAGRNSGKGPPIHGDDEDEVVDGMQIHSSPTGGKRRHKEYEEPVSRGRPKRRNSRPHDDEGIDIPTSPELASSPASSADIMPDNATNLPIRAAFIPDRIQEDTWACALDGCTHKIYGVSHPDSQRLIKEHYELHAFDDDAKVQMVKRLQAPSMPVSHLMEKVKLAAKNHGVSDGLDRHMPDQVRSRFPTLPGSVLQRY